MKLTNITNYLGITNIQPKPEGTPAVETFSPEKLGPKEVYLAWQGAGRPEKKGFNKKTARTLLVIGVVISLLLAIMGEFWLILVMGSMVFVTFVLSSTPPQSASYEISNHGIKFDEMMYYWHQLKNYFFYTADGTEMLAVSTMEAFPGRLFILINPADKEKINGIMSSRLNFLQEAPKTVIDKAYNSIIDKFNF
jgi:hypothetical protein